MGQRGAIHGLACILLACIVGANAGSYLVTAPERIIKGSNYDVTVDIFNSTSDLPVDFQVKLIGLYSNETNRMHEPHLFSIANATITPGQTGILSLQIDKDLACDRCKIQIRGTGGLQIDAGREVVLNSDVVSILVQTDKAIYKPGQIVRYRALGVYPDLSIYNGQYAVKIKDPRGNVIQYRQNVVSEDGVIEGSLAISDQPLFGDWTIEVSLAARSYGVLTQTNQEFTVADYELPRFEVIVELPPYGLVRDTLLTGKVKAKYTFGQPVKGMVELHVGPNRGPDYCGKLPDTTQIAFEINGEANFEVPKEDYSRAMGYIGDRSEVKVTAFVKEEATGIRLNGSSVVTLYSNAYKIRFLENTPDVFKPGLQYTAFIQVSTPDDMPPADNVQRVVSVYTTATYRVKVPDQRLYSTNEFRGTYALPGQNLTLPASGILAVDVEIPQNATEITIKATYGDVMATQTVSNAYSSGNTFLQLVLEEKNVKAGTIVPFLVKGTEPLGQLSYTVLSRGSIVRSAMLDGEGQKEFTFDLSVDSTMAPTAHIIVYYNTDENEVVADSLAFNVDGLFANEVSVSFSTNRSEPAQSISLNVTAEPESTICVLAVDQSVLLLKQGNDITAEKVGDEVSRYVQGEKPSGSEFALSLGSESAGDAFRSVGLLVMTDVSLERPRPPPIPRPQYGMRGPPGAYAEEVAYDSMPSGRSRGTTTRMPRLPAAKSSLAEVERIRNIFPEAWLWTRGVAGPDGSISFETTVPDTITSWVASAFAVHSSAGLGVAPTTAKLQVFRPFFVSLTYPSSVVRGEKVVIQATVFNYLGTDVNVRVTMKASNKYKNLRASADGTETELTGDVVYDILVASDEQGVVYFPILATQIGVADLEVTAQTVIAADGVRRSIYVQSEGAAASYNLPVFVMNDEASDVFSDTLALTLPPFVVEGSINSRVKVTGDLIGASLGSLTSLLALPTGCGEQSMVKFAPDLFIYRYLQATGQLTDALKQHIEGFLEAGYQRQLTYQRYDGGFSAFGNTDSASSTWLTAFVLRTFIQARDIIYIEDKMLRRGISWLINHMDREGSFKEFGNVLDATIQATSNKESLSAYVLLALIEGRSLYEDFHLTLCEEDTSVVRYGNIYRETCTYVNATRDVKNYLERNVDTVDDQLSLAVISLALSRAGSTRAQEVFARLQTTARQSGALSYWADNSTVSSDPTVKDSFYYANWELPHVQARPLDILITSYAIMTYIDLGQQDQALPAVTWLTQQRNDKGGFVSSQDTILALEALSKYASTMIPPETNLTVRVTPQGSSDEISFDVTRDNALSLQTQQLPLPLGPSSNVDLMVSGLGMALVEFDVRFFVSTELITPYFEVNTVLLDDDLDNFNLMICTKLLSDRQTGMVVQEISIPSGFEPDLHSTDNVAGMKKAERKGNVVEVYFDQITKTSLCYSIIMTRTGKVANIQENYVRTFDYYKPAYQSTVFYQPIKIRDAGICDVCDGCCDTQ